jgi:hypothetical protein
MTSIIDNENGYESDGPDDDTDDEYEYYVELEDREKTTKTHQQVLDDCRNASEWDCATQDGHVILEACGKMYMVCHGELWACVHRSPDQGKLVDLLTYLVTGGKMYLSIDWSSKSTVDVIEDDEEDEEDEEDDEEDDDEDDEEDEDDDDEEEEDIEVCYSALYAKLYHQRISDVAAGMSPEAQLSDLQQLHPAAVHVFTRQAMIARGLHGEWIPENIEEALDPFLQSFSVAEELIQVTSDS